jgi:hypothetical protein
MAHRPDIPLPDITLIGREQEVERCVIAITAHDPLAVALRGMGGQGKTAVAYEVINDRRVVERFRNRRSVFRCDRLGTVEAVQAQIAAVFGWKAPERCQAADEFERRLQTAFCEPSLVILDNLETLLTPVNTAFDPQERPRNARQLLKVLLNVPRLALIITMRGDSEPIKHSRWASGNDSQALLLLFGLAKPIAREILLGMCNLKDDDEEEARALASLLDLIQGHPLSLTLLAGATSSGSIKFALKPLIKLYEEYKSQGTRLLCDDTLTPLASSPELRQLSVKICLSLSYNDPRLTLAGRGLLRLLAFLPHDVGADEVANLTADVAAVEQLAVLSNLSLASIGCALISRPRGTIRLMR